MRTSLNSSGPEKHRMQQSEARRVRSETLRMIRRVRMARRASYGRYRACCAGLAVIGTASSQESMWKQWRSSEISKCYQARVARRVNADRQDQRAPGRSKTEAIHRTTVAFISRILSSPEADRAPAVQGLPIHVPFPPERDAGRTKTQSFACSSTRPLRACSGVSSFVRSVHVELDPSALCHLHLTLHTRRSGRRRWTFDQHGKGLGYNVLLHQPGIL